jgi:hypothetical protein
MNKLRKAIAKMYVSLVLIQNSLSEEQRSELASLADKIERKDTSELSRSKMLARIADILMGTAS